MSVDAESGGAKIRRCVFLFNPFKLNFILYHDYNSTYPPIYSNEFLHGISSFSIVRKGEISTKNITGTTKDFTWGCFNLAYIEYSPPPWI